MLRKVTQEVLRDDEFRVEVKTNFIGDDLGDDLSFKTIYEKFKDYAFTNYFNEIYQTYNYKSVSNALFYYTYKLNEEDKIKFLYQRRISMFCDSDEIIDFLNVCELDNESINEADLEIKNNFNYITNIKLKAKIDTTFYKLLTPSHRESDFDEEEDEDDYESEEEYNDYLPNLELPFFQDTCSICMDNKPQILILPCLHICHCIACDEEGLINKCPICREKIERKIVITK